MAVEYLQIQKDQYDRMVNQIAELQEQLLQKKSEENKPFDAVNDKSGPVSFNANQYSESGDEITTIDKSLNIDSNNNGIMPENAKKSKTKSTRRQKKKSITKKDIKMKLKPPGLPAKKKSKAIGRKLDGRVIEWLKL